MSEVCERLAVRPGFCEHCRTPLAKCLRCGAYHCESVSVEVLAGADAMLCWWCAFGYAHPSGVC